MPPHHTPISRLYLAYISPISRLDLAREPGAQVRNLDLAAYTQLSEEDQAKGVQTKFNLMSSTQHDGQPESGTYRTYVHFKANDQWYDIQDLHVNGVHPQLISVSESYIQVYDSSPS